MTIKILKEMDAQDKEHLNAFIAAQGLPPLALPQWLDLASSVFERSTLCMISYTQDGEINGFCGGYHAKLVFYSLPFGFYANDEQVAQNLRAELATYAADIGLQKAYIHTDHAYKALGEAAQRYHLEVPLTVDSEDELHALIPKKQRNMIKKAQKQGYELSRSWAHIDGFYDLYANHCRQKSLTQKPKTYFDGLHRVFKDDAILYSALEQGKPVAAMLFLKSSHAASYLFNAADFEAQKTGVNNLLMSEASVDFLKQGLGFIELGLSRVDSPVYNFKKRLSKDIAQRPVYTYEYAFRPLSLKETLIQFAANKYNGLLYRLRVNVKPKSREEKIF